MTISANEWLVRNREYHNRIAGSYRNRHTEIYNPIEQARLAGAIASAIDQIESDADAICALDVGAGVGNLTAHLLRRGCHVTAADISEAFLSEIEKEFAEYQPFLNTALLNGKDLANWPDGSFHFCGTYSVLHHVPDYLSLVEEMARVVCPGGVLFIDHESSLDSWNPSPEGLEYLRRFREGRKPSWKERWGPSGLWYRFKWKWHTLQDPRYQEEGDIHIWPDDHIEWGLIEDKLRPAGFTKIIRQDYLVCRETIADAPLYHEFAEKYQDMTLLVAIKA